MSRFREHKLFYTFVILVDTLIVIGSYYAAFHVRFSIGNIPIRNMQAFLDVLPWMALISILVFLLYDAYVIASRVTWENISSTIVSVVVIAGLIGLASFTFRAFAFPRSIILIGACISLTAILFWKYMLSIFIKDDTKNILIIGTDEEVHHVQERVAQNLSKRANFISLPPDEKLDVMYSRIAKADNVFICDSVDKRISQTLIQECMVKQVKVYVVPEVYELLLSKADATTFDDLLVMSVKDWKLPPDKQIIKRIGDLVFSICLLILTLPIMIVVALALKISEPRHPVIYKQKRMTIDDKEFDIYKFRTMIPNAECNSGPVLASKSDERITPVGRFLRATRLDELPQLFNVLKGDMSVVGPRPERPHFTEIYKKKYGAYRYRSAVKAGLTGLAQINGKYETDVEDKLRYDLYYIRNYSVFFDIVIILKTLKVLLDKQKASGVALPKKVENMKESKNIGM